MLNYWLSLKLTRTVNVRGILEELVLFHSQLVR